MAKAIVPILPGQQFGKLTTIEPAGKSGTNTLWKCRCVCGTISYPRDTRLRCGATTRCAKCTKVTHGHTRGKKPSLVYRRWGDMIKRCTNPNHVGWEDYGGRGITVCERWRSFENFLADMGQPPSSKHELDRIDNNRGYEPSNVRWATRSENMRNTRRNHLVTFNGKTQCLSAWAAELGINYGTLRSRIGFLGWSTEDALNHRK